MDLASLKSNPAAVENGDWVDSIPDMGDLRLKVRGTESAEWRRLMGKLHAAVPRQKRAAGALDPEENDRMISTCLLEIGLLDWDGLTGEDGKPIPYSKERAAELLTQPEYRSFRNAVLWAATIVGQASAIARQADTKN